MDLRADADLLPLTLPATVQFCLCDVEWDGDSNGSSESEYDTGSERLGTRPILCDEEGDGDNSGSSENFE